MYSLLLQLWFNKPALPVWEDCYLQPKTHYCHQMRGEEYTVGNPLNRPFFNYETGKWEYGSFVRNPRNGATETKEGFIRTEPRNSFRRH